MKLLKTTFKLFRISQKKLFVISTFFSVVLIFSYLFSVNATILNTSERAQMQEEADTLRYETGEIEFTLIAKKNDIDLDTARAIGFKEAEDVTFIPRQAVAAAIGF